MRRLFATVCVCLMPWASFGACSGADGDASSFVGGTSPTGGAFADSGQSFDAAFSTATQVRLVHLSDSSSPIDFCYRAIGTTDFSGPVLAETSLSADAGPVDSGAPLDGGSSDSAVDGAAPIVKVPTLGASALAHLSASPIISLPTPGTLELAIVNGEHPTCNSPLVSATLTLDAGKTAWIALVGEDGGDGGVSSLSVKRLIVDTRPDDMHARIRVMHAATAQPGPIDVSVTSELTTALATGIVRFATTLTSRSPALDSLGYATIAPVSPPTMFLIAPSDLDAGDGDSGAWWASAFTDLGLTAGSVHTAFVASNGTALSVLSCSEVGSGECVRVTTP